MSRKFCFQDNKKAKGAFKYYQEYFRSILPIFHTALYAGFTSLFCELAYRFYIIYFVFSRTLNQPGYTPYGGHPYSYTDPSGKLHFTPVQQTPDGVVGRLTNLQNCS